MMGWWSPKALLLESLGMKSINQEPNNYWFNLSIFVWYLRPQQRVNGQIDGEITPHQMSETAQPAHHSPDIDRYTHRSWTILSSWIFITQLIFFLETNHIQNSLCWCKFSINSTICRYYTDLYKLLHVKW